MMKKAIRLNGVIGENKLKTLIIPNKYSDKQSLDGINSFIDGFLRTTRENERLSV